MLALSLPILIIDSRSVVASGGRVIDLHALRTTLGTQLARAGVTPQVAQRIMRHGDYRTTLKHYTVLGLTDTAAAIDRLPGIARERVAHAATGTTDSAPQALPSDTQLFCQQLERETGRNSAASRGELTHDSDRDRNEKPRHSPGFSATFPSDSSKAGDATRTRNIQHGRLALYH